MAEAHRTNIERKIEYWIGVNKKEDSRLEFKRRVELAPPGAKAEFIRDVIALANSEGERPRSEGYYVIGAQDGRHYDVGNEHYDGATFSQILDSYVYPPIQVTYREWGNKGTPRTGVLTVMPDVETLYIVGKRLSDEKGRALLSPGQCWGRKADRKTELDGKAIHDRLHSIIESSIENATHPLKERIKELEHQSGPVFEVRRIRLDMEATADWASLDGYLQKLIPYPREFGRAVEQEVLNAVMAVTSKTRQGMPSEVAQSVEAVLMEVMPVKAGGLRHPAGEKPTDEDQELLKKMEQAVFELAWDACRYLRDTKLVEVGARLYWALIRFSTLNRLRLLQAESLENARRCRQICLEERRGEAFPAGYEMLGAEIADALKAFDYDCEGYKIGTPSPKDVSAADLAACVRVIEKGEAVDSKSARRELPLASALAVVWKGKEIVGVGAIKRERRKYAAGIAAKSGVDFPPETLELGYIAVLPEHRGHHLSHCVVQALLKQHRGRLFATTYDDRMKNTLTQAAFERRGAEWRGKRRMLSFWEREI